MINQDKKVGIVTHYYKSKNYGGNLQAYALCRVIQDKFQLDVEQISYDIFSHRQREWRSITPKRVLSKMKALFATRKVDNADEVEVAKAIAKRNTVIDRFNQNMIPHSKRVYNRLDIENANENYDVFITGSDQVWHPNVMCPAYLLSFADSNKTKISYAASLACNELGRYHQKMMRRALTDYTAISVREETGQEIIKNLTDKPVDLVLDPTLLLTRTEWDEICPGRAIDAPYLFCYFLGDSTEQRELAEEYAQARGLQVVTLPYLNGGYRACDDGFGDIKLYEVDPAQFISLIKFADIIFTDSFHGVVFSTIYKRKAYVFQRGGASNMSSRLKTLMRLTHREEYFCDTEEKTTLSYLDSIDTPYRTEEAAELENMHQMSLKFLELSLWAER